jgi:hypothetical protein
MLVFRVSLIVVLLQKFSALTMFVFWPGYLLVTWAYHCIIKHSRYLCPQPIMPLSKQKYPSWETLNHCILVYVQVWTQKTLPIIVLGDFTNLQHPTCSNILFKFSALHLFLCEFCHMHNMQCCLILELISTFWSLMKLSTNYGVYWSFR